ncbi:hypothetical protein SOM11_00280 [Frigoribacterium sp. CFBP9039]|uniref:hypothetical protein n=1 Tax=Frigoribacterium sp. CFBP9029 TaxID=3096541 RepID=UPI002A6A8CDB|nr:hypothetical protein [Frigoribacterium sp. CFBP9039]MDY0944421.1 hypothetical protein [Frigoribacterium sp. CFBP9039]
MSGAAENDPVTPTDPSADRRRPALLWLLIVLLVGELAVVASAAGYLLVELVVETPSSYASAVAVLLLTLMATAWIGSIVVGAFRGRAWIRGAAIVWQVLQIAVGVGSLQGTFANPTIGLWLIVPAVLVVVLLLTPSVVAATSRRDDVPPRTY